MVTSTLLAELPRHGIDPRGMVHGTEVHVIKRAETLDDVLARDQVPAHLALADVRPVRVVESTASVNH